MGSDLLTKVKVARELHFEVESLVYSLCDY